MQIYPEDLGRTIVKDRLSLLKIIRDSRPDIQSRKGFWLFAEDFDKEPAYYQFGENTPWNPTYLVYTDLDDNIVAIHVFRIKDTPVAGYPHFMGLQVLNEYAGNHLSEYIINDTVKYCKELYPDIQGITLECYEKSLESLYSRYGFKNVMINGILYMVKEFNDTNKNKLRTDILTAYESMESCRFAKRMISDSVFANFKNNIHKYSVLYESKESLFFEGLLNIVNALYNININEAERLTFFNPFSADEIDGKDTANNTDIIDEPNKTGLKINSVRVWNSNTADKTYYKEGGVYAGKHFSKGDTVESCPVRFLNKKDLYSRVIRDIAFPIDMAHNIYAIPFGKAIFYNNSLESGREGNVTYNFKENDMSDDKVDGYIIIKALKNIKANDELILLSDEADFENDAYEHKYKQLNMGITKELSNVKFV